MIVEMKKITLLCLAEDATGTLDALRDVGVLHLQHVNDPGSADLAKLRDDHARAVLALNTLSQYSSTDTGTDGDPATVIEEANQILESRRKLDEKLTQLNDERTPLEPLGNFDPQLIERFRDRGIVVKLYRITDKTVPEPPEGVGLFMLSESARGRYVALVGGEDFEFPAREVPLPERRLADIDADIEGVRAELARTEARLTELSAHLSAVVDKVADIDEQIRYVEARDGMAAEGKLAYLQGFCPAGKVYRLKSAAEDHGWGLVLDDPSEDDNVPTLVRYPAWARVMRPVFKFLGITPGYREADISSAFFVFLTIFFAMIVGDAGYGLLFLILLPYFRHTKFRKAPAEPFRLLYTFSIATVVWGVLTGNYFGIDYALLPGLLQAVRVDWLITQSGSMTFSLLLGAIHLTLAHGWKAVIYGRDPRTAVQAGWICIVWCVFALARQLLVHAPLPWWFFPALVAGLLAIPVGLFLRKAWMDLGLMALDLVSCFGDIMSYLRLFALGIASVKVAEAFNGMAGDLAALLLSIGGGGGFLAFTLPLAAAAMAVILGVGHGLNIILCAMSVLVHGIRLNALEFSLHLGQEWSGFEYKPFSSRSAANLDAAA